MNSWRTLVILLFVLLLFSPVKAQTFDGTWSCDYATIDDQPNATGYNTPAVAVIKENCFVALVRRGTNSTNYLVGYSNADSLNGRMGYYAYAPAGYRMQWSSGFDAVEMLEAMDIAATPDSLIYVASNDAETNILVFKMSADSIVSTDFRLVTGADSIWAIDVDASGYVYVTVIKDELTSGQVLVFAPVTDAMWMSHTGAPVQTITVPDPGELRGVAVNSDGTALYVSNYQTKKVYCYTGSPIAGYTLNNAFTFELPATDVVPDADTLKVGPWGMAFMNTKNILWVTSAVSFTTGAGYSYSRIYALNPNTGAVLDTIDTAMWNFLQTGAYNDRPGGTTGNVSGYASTYGVAYDESFHLYDVSYYGWTVDKWSFSGTLPVIPLTIVGIEKEDYTPETFTMSQNYPNPFNPATSIEFSIPSTSNVSLNVYTVNGELVTTLINSSEFERGTYKYTFNASKLASGTYIYTLRYGDQQLTRKMTLVK